MKLPFSEDAETYLLSSFMVDFQGVGCLLAERKVTPEAFHHPANRHIATVMMEAWGEGRKMDAFLLNTELQRRGVFDEAGKHQIFDRVHAIPTAANAAQYVETVLETDQLRRIALLCAEKAQDAQERGAEPSSIISDLSEGIADISGVSRKDSFMTMKDHYEAKIARIESNEDDKNIIKTGIDKLDLHSPLRQGDMPLISGERKAGKSIFAINIAVNVALCGGGVIYFSLEDDSTKVYDRIFSKVSRVPIDRQKMILMSQWEVGQVNVSAKKLHELPITLRHDVHDLAGIVGLIRQAKLQNPNLKIAVVDYAQLVETPSKKGDNREQEVALISRTLRLLAMDTQVTIILLCQLNKDGNARWSMGLEHDCTAMWKINHTEDKDKGKRIIEISFQRNGDSNICFPVAFLGKTAQIETLANTPDEES